MYARIVDGIRADGSLVVLKEIKLHSDQEIPIGKLFSSGTLAKHPKNHCVPFMDVIEPSEGSGSAFVVMPYLLDTDNPPFETIGEVVAYFKQIFELAFDSSLLWTVNKLTFANLFLGLSDYSRPSVNRLSLLPNLFSELSTTKTLPQRTSRTRKPVRYYIIDFGLSRVCRPEDAPHLRQPPWGGDKSVPEFLLPDAKACDPFAVGVYCIGNSIRTHYTDVRLLKNLVFYDVIDKETTTQGWDGFAKRKQGFEFMKELVDDMTNPDPQKRPPMTDVVSRFEEISKGLDDKKLRSPVLDVGDKLGTFEKIVHWTTQWTNKLRSIPAIPGA
ncbi:hypothetical protein C0993_006162 [Termitomyces sp. T159_Od127]|nr:hypothetical protein C0993_006162 [Termitomyces sp. T159_Od127]